MSAQRRQPDQDAGGGGLSPREQRLEDGLRVLLEPQSDPAMARRILAASLPRLVDGQADPEPTVLFRFDRRVGIRRLAMAACLVLAAVVAIRFGMTPIPQPPMQNAMLSLEDEQLLYDDLDMGEYAYLAETREMAFAELRADLDDMRHDLELWQYGLLTD